MFRHAARLDELLPLDHVLRGERGGDDGELAGAAAEPRRFVHQRVADALGRGLVHEEIAGRGLRVGIEGDDLDAFVLRPLQRRGDAVLVLAGDGDDIHAERDPVLDDLVLFGGIGADRAVEDQLRAEYPWPLGRRLVCTRRSSRCPLISA